MSDVSPLLALPLILADQAQKHVSHNEAIDLLDVLVQLVVEQIDAITPPAAAVEGAVWALGEVPLGAWAGQALRLASWRGGAWVFIAPAIGWRAWVRGAGVLRVFTGSGWVGLLGANDLQNLGGVGINTTSDASNKLAVASAATLLSHAGAGHQLKVNKATAPDTASLLFQSGWSGRAEMGLAGNDDFSVKVSADGAAWNTALALAGATGTVTVPAGLLLADGSAASPGLRFAADVDTGLCRPAANKIGLVAGGVQRALLSSTTLQVDVALTGTAVTQTTTDTTAGRVLKVGDFGLGTAAGITTFGRGNILGTVSHASGVPTGAVIERGSNANGDYARFADGTMICTTPALAFANASTADGAIFGSDPVTWTFPSPFVAAPVVSGGVDDIDCWISTGLPTPTTCALRARSSVTKAAALNGRLVAQGRWF